MNMSWWNIIKSKWMGQMSDGKKELLEHKPKVKIDIPKMSYPDDRKEVKEVIKIMKEKPVPKDIMSRHDKDSDQVLFDIVDAKSSDYEDFTKDLNSYVMREKVKYARKRPNEVSDILETKTETDDTPAFPSGHATLVYGLEKMLADKYPEKKKELNKTAEMLALARVQLGSHYPSDIKAGKKLGYLIAKKYLED